MGDWRPEDADRAVKAASDAGYDLIERAHAASLHLLLEAEMLFLDWKALQGFS